MISGQKIKDPWISKKIDFNKKSVSYITKGTGNSIVMLHGYLDSSQIWYELGSRLSNLFKVIAVDLPGHGNSDACPPVHTMDLMAEAVLKVFQNEGIQKACIAGHSMGGYVALAFADIYPEFTKSLILINSDPFSDTPERIIKRNREITLIKAGKKELLLALSNTISYADPNPAVMQNKPMELIIPGPNISDDAMIATIEGMKQRSDRIRVLQNANIQTLFIMGKKDPQSNTVNLLEKISPSGNVNYIILENAGHRSFTEEPEIILQKIMDFAWQYE
jgi:pimeloyl-ACP methyl ester carboxylesterase